MNNRNKKKVGRATITVRAYEGFVTVLVSSVTAPVCASALPFSVAPVVKVTDE